MGMQLYARVWGLNKLLRPIGTRPSGVAQADGEANDLAAVTLIFGWETSWWGLGGVIRLFFAHARPLIIMEKDDGNIMLYPSNTFIYYIKVIMQNGADLWTAVDSPSRFTIKSLLLLSNKSAE